MNFVFYTIFTPKSTYSLFNRFTVVTVGQFTKFEIFLVLFSFILIYNKNMDFFWIMDQRYMYKESWSFNLFLKSMLQFMSKSKHLHNWWNFGYECMKEPIKLEHELFMKLRKVTGIVWDWLDFFKQCYKLLLIIF